MTDIFISYAREDRSRVEPLVRVLEERGYSVWWDRELVPGASFEKAIDAAITRARCVVVVWTHGSVDSEWVQAEAGDGLERGILVPVMMDAVRVPISFRRKHASQLLAWPKLEDPREIEFLLRGIEECLAREGASSDDAPSSHMPHPVIHDATSVRFLQDAQPRSVRTRLITALSIGLLAASAYVIYELVPTPSPSSHSTVADYSIAVIPFIDPDSMEVTTTAQVRAQSEIAFEITRMLSRIPELRVISNEAVLGMLAEADVEAIRRKLSVNYLIEGQPSEGTTTISLVNTLSGATLWTEVFETPRDPLFTIVSTIANRVARSLELTAPEGAAADTISEQAYLAYLRGRGELRKPRTEQARAAARSEFTTAITLAPRFGEAYAGLCRANIHDYVVSASGSDFEAAEKHCHRALTLDDNNNEVHIALGYLFRYSGQYERALESYRRVLADVPFNAEALRGTGVTYWDMGLAEKAERQFKLLIEIEPGFWENYQKLGNLYFNSGRFIDAATNYEIQADLVRDRAPVMNNLAAAYFLAEDFDRAVKAWNTAVALEPNAITFSNIASAQFFRGDFSQSAKMYERAIALAPDDHRSWGNAADAYFFAEAEHYADYYAKAIELANNQLAINPNDYAILSAVAAYHSAIDHAEDALKALSRARALNEDDIYLAYDAAIVYARLGRETDAEQALGELLGLGYSRQLIAMDANFRDFTHVLDKEEP